jgi:hypothetical protein
VTTHFHLGFVQKSLVYVQVVALPVHEYLNELKIVQDDPRPVFEKTRFPRKFQGL